MIELLGDAIEQAVDLELETRLHAMHDSGQNQAHDVAHGGEDVVRLQLAAVALAAVAHHQVHGSGDAAHARRGDLRDGGASDGGEDRAARERLLVEVPEHHDLEDHVRHVR